MKKILIALTVSVFTLSAQAIHFANEPGQPVIINKSADDPNVCDTSNAANGFACELQTVTLNSAYFCSKKTETCNFKRAMHFDVFWNLSSHLDPSKDVYIEKPICYLNNIDEVGNWDGSLKCTGKYYTGGYGNRKYHGKKTFTLSTAQQENLWFSKVSIK